MLRRGAVSFQSFFSVDRCADLGVVGKENAAGAVRSRRRKQHAVAVFVAEFVRLQIHEHDDLPAPRAVRARTGRQWRTR